VRGDQDGGSVTSEAVEEHEHGLGPGLVDSTERLVEQEDLGLLGDRPREKGSLELSS